MVRLPAISGIIDRRMLVNYRVDADVLASALPEPFEPQLVNGYGIAGICLIRLKNVRPKGLSRLPGFGSENAAHRIAVTWNEDGQPRHGVYIPHRDTNSNLNVMLGGRLFPGIHHRAIFTVNESKDQFDISLVSDDGDVTVEVRSRLADALPEDSIFGSLDSASLFFQAGSVGYSATRDPQQFDGLELCCQHWAVEPLAVEWVKSSFFDDAHRFPAGSVAFDCALLMRNIEHEWNELSPLCCAADAGAT